MPRKKADIIYQCWGRIEIHRTADGKLALVFSLEDDKATDLLKKIDPKMKTTKQRTK